MSGENLRPSYIALVSIFFSAVCISVAMALIVPTPLLKPREYGLIGWADHLTLASTNRSMTFEKDGSSEWDDAFCLSLGLV